MAECELCNQGDPSINVRCWYCGKLSHLHHSQLDQVNEGEIVMTDCLECGATNCWVKAGKGVAVSGAVIYDGQPVTDLRGHNI
ncbi:hypothetical protein ES703_32099 [subsurface metagenome]